MLLHIERAETLEQPLWEKMNDILTRARVVPVFLLSEYEKKILIVAQGSPVP